MQTDCGRFFFVFVVNRTGIRRATYLCLDSTKNVDKNWYTSVSFNIHVNFDTAWVEHYPETYIYGICVVILIMPYIKQHSQRECIYIHIYIYIYIFICIYIDVCPRGVYWLVMVITWKKIFTILHTCNLPPLFWPCNASMQKRKLHCGILQYNCFVAF